jgi:glycosidase
MRRFSLHIASIALVAALLPESGCVSVPDDGKPPILATHVQDWRDEVIYQVLVDRFANGDVNNDMRVQEGALARFQGGDWKGMEDHLDYFVDLGVTTLWISPVVKNVETDADVDSYHGYWAQDLTLPNPHFGDLAALRSLVASAHDKGLKVVLDIVTNHMGQVFFYDMNLNGHPDIYIGGTGCDPNSPASAVDKNPDGSCPSNVTRVTEFDPDFVPRGVQAFTSLGPAGRAPIIFIQDPTINRVPPKPDILGTARAYHGMGRTLNYDVPDQRLHGDFPGGLKDVATEVPEVRAALIDAYAKWVETADLDGFRIDTVKHVEEDFWSEFATKVRQRLAPQGKTKFLMFGEAFDGDDALLGRYTQPGMLDSVFYFSQHFQVFRDVFQLAHDPTQQKGTDQIANLWAEKPVHYSTQPQDGGIGVPPSKALVNFLDNHDVSRFLFDAQGDKDALRNALTFLLTEEGIPCLYYGTEQEFAGGNDPSNREVLWTTGWSNANDTFQHFRKLSRLRKGYKALSRGDTKVVWSTPHVAAEEDAGIFAFERAGGDAADQYALVVFNTNAKKASSTSDGAKTMQTSQKATQLVDVLDPAHTPYTTDATGALKVSVPAQKALVLVPAAQVVANL